MLEEPHTKTKSFNFEQEYESFVFLKKKIDKKDLIVVQLFKRNTLLEDDVLSQGAFAIVEGLKVK